MLSDADYFSILFEIANTLNKESSLHTALKKSLEKCVNLLELETGWIWLLESETSVSLAASYHNLPPALSEHPERLSGWCYCIQNYFTDSIHQAQNISEIVCSRLTNIKSGTNDLKFHATIPIKNGEHKIGLINLLSIKSQELNEIQLNVLNTIGNLIGIAVQRTKNEENYRSSSHHSNLSDLVKRVFSPKLLSITNQIENIQPLSDNVKLSSALFKVLSDVKTLQLQLDQVVNDVRQVDLLHQKSNTTISSNSILTKREFELLKLVKKGLTNKQIAESIFITERTVKFHISAILNKLDARTRTEAVNIAIQKGFI